MTQCAWCQEEAVGEIELEPVSKGRDKRTGAPVIKRQAKTAPVCPTHRMIIDTQPPFYTCGCSYVEDELRCPRHTNLLRQPHRDRLTKEVIKDAS